MDANEKLSISKLPLTMNNPVNNEKKMPLVGMVAFYYTRMSGSRIVQNENADPNVDWNIGHYTGWVKRGNQWFEYDDNKGKKKSHKCTAKLVPHILIYLNI